MATVVSPIPSLPASELEARRFALESALGTTLAEGVSPSPQALALGELYASGELDLDAYIASVKALYER